jgi:hypothetical protein
MVRDGIASQVGWLYPVALVGLVAGIAWRGRAPRTDLARSGFLMWGVWLVTHVVAFSTGRVAHEWVRTCRRELLDPTLIWNQRHLLQTLRGFEFFYTAHRPHQGIANAQPLQPLPEPIKIQIASLT